MESSEKGSGRSNGSSTRQSGKLKDVASTPGALSDALARQLLKPWTEYSEADEFAQVLLKKCLANLCMSLGYTSASDPALTLLAKLCKEKIISLGSNLKSVAEASGRKRVVLEDFAEVVRTSSEFHGVSREPLRYPGAIPSFPVETPNPHVSGPYVSDEGTVQTLAGLAHFPPLPPPHTYKRTKLELPEIPASSAAELKRAQQRHSALVRESLARMKREANPTSTGAQNATDNDISNDQELARLIEGDFDS